MYINKLFLVLVLFYNLENVFYNHLKIELYECIYTVSQDDLFIYSDMTYIYKFIKILFFWLVSFL